MRRHHAHVVHSREQRHRRPQRLRHKPHFAQRGILARHHLPPNIIEHQRTDLRCQVKRVRMCKRRKHRIRFRPIPARNRSPRRPRIKPRRARRRNRQPIPKLLLPFRNVFAAHRRLTWPNGQAGTSRRYWIRRCSGRHTCAVRIPRHLCIVLYLGFRRGRQRLGEGRILRRIHGNACGALRYCLYCIPVLRKGEEQKDRCEQHFVTSVVESHALRSPLSTTENILSQRAGRTGPLVTFLLVPSSSTSVCPFRNSRTTPKHEHIFTFPAHHCRIHTRTFISIWTNNGAHIPARSSVTSIGSSIRGLAPHTKRLFSAFVRGTTLL